MLKKPIPKQKNAPLELYKIGKMIKKEREQRKLSLRQLSEKVFGNEYYASAILKIENGNKPKVEFMTIVKILRVFEIKIV